MKKIKLAVLALALVCGSVGAYAKYQKRLQLYYVDPLTSFAASQFRIAANSPAPDCQTGIDGYVCTMLAEDALPIGTVVPSQEATIITVYQ